jgi:DNA repair protein RadC
VVRIARPIFAELDTDKEHFVLLALNNKNRINGAKVISTGTLTATLIRPGDVYAAALDLRAAAVVFVHNPPSGDPAPSQEDVEITRRLKECGEMLAIRVLDHVILGVDGYYSFSDWGSYESAGDIERPLEFHRKCEIKDGRQPRCYAE